MLLLLFPLPTIWGADRGVEAEAAPALGLPVLWENRTQTLSPQLPSSSPGGDPGPVIGRAVSCVDPGGPPKDTQVLLSSLVWRCCPLPNVAHEVIESCSTAGGSVPGWAASSPTPLPHRYQMLPWWCFSRLLLQAE